MSTFSTQLLQMARTKVAAEARDMQKSAVVPPAPPMDPAMMGAAGAAPPADPAAMGGAPPMDPAMMGGAPPMDPAMAGGAPVPPDPAAGAVPPPTAPAVPGAPAAPAAAAAPPKMKPEDRMNQIDFRLYNMQQQLTAIMNAMGIDLPAGALVTPPGSPVPVAEAAVPGGMQDPGPAAGGQPGGEQNGTGINPIEAMQAFNPGGGGGGGGEKQAGADISALINSIVGRGINQDILKSAAEYPQAQPAPQPVQTQTQRAQANIQNNIAATAAILRSRVTHK